MTPEELINAAQDALGKGKPDDYAIEPTKHAAELADKAPALAALLRKSALSTVAEEYERKNGEAKRAQDAFKESATNANKLVLGTATLSALMLTINPLLLLVGWQTTVPVTAIGVLGIVTGGLAAMFLNRAKEGKLLDAWMSSRAAAEAMRTKYFETATSMEDSISSAIPLPLLQFEYFRRYQLDVQRAYYSSRGADHQRDADRQLRESTMAVAAASIMTALATLLSSQNANWVLLAVFGNIATAFSSYSATKESVNQSRRNAEQYGKAYDALGLLRQRLDDVRLAAADGERGPMKEFVAAVHEQMGVEHRQWLAAAENVQPALDKLDETLSKLQAKKEEAKKAAGNETEAKEPEAKQEPDAQAPKDKV